MEIDCSFSKPVMLLNVRSVIIRNVRPVDKPLIIEALERFSPATICGRFLTARQSFSEEDLRYLTEFDAEVHFALGSGIRWLRLWRSTIRSLL
jgi:hypothetical protein